MKTMAEFNQLENKARKNAGKRVKIRSGLYYYRPLNSDELFEIEKLPGDFVDVGMWAIHGEHYDSQIGDYDLHFTLREAMGSLDR